MWTQSEIQRIFQVTGYSTLLRQTYPGIQQAIEAAQQIPNGVQPDSSLEDQVRSWLALIDQIESQIMTVTTAAIVSQDTNQTQFSPGKAMMLNKIEGQRICDRICDALYIPRNQKYFFGTTRTVSNAY